MRKAKHLLALAILLAGTSAIINTNKNLTLNSYADMVGDIVVCDPEPRENCESPATGICYENYKKKTVVVEVNQ